MSQGKAQTTLFFILVAGVAMALLFGITWLVLKVGGIKIQNEVDVFLDTSDKGSQLIALLSSKVSDRTFMEVTGDMFTSNYNDYIKSDVEELEKLLPKTDLKYYFLRYGSRAILSDAHTTEFDSIIVESAQTYSVDPALIKAVIDQESDFMATAVSDTGAAGLMQFVPSTAKEQGLNVPEYERELVEVPKPGGGTKEIWVPVCRKKFENYCEFEEDERFDPEKSIMAGAKYLSELINRYNGDVSRALLAYSGEWYDFSDIEPIYNQYTQISPDGQPSPIPLRGLTPFADIPIPGARPDNFRGGIRLE